MKASKQALILVCLVLMIIVPSLTHGQDTPSATAYIRLWNLDGDSRTLDIYWNDQLILEDVEGGAWIDNVAVEPAFSQVEVTDSETGEVRGTIEITLEADRYYNVFLIGSFNQPLYALTLIEEDRSPFPDNIPSRFYLVNGLENSRISYQLSSFPDLALGYGEFWGTPIVGGDFELAIQAEDWQSELNESLTIDPYSIYFAAVAVVDGEPQILVSRQSFVAQMGFKVLAVDTPPFNLFLDDRIWLDGVSYEEVDRRTVFPSGVFHLKLVSIDDPNLIIYEQEEVAFYPDDSFTIWLMGQFNTDTFEVKWVNDREVAEPIVGEDFGAEQTYVRFHHFSPDTPAIDILYADGSLVVENLSYGDTGYFDAMAGQYDLLIKPTGDAETTILDLSQWRLAGGVAYDLYIIGHLADMQAGLQRPYVEAGCVLEAGCPASE